MKLNAQNVSAELLRTQRKIEAMNRMYKIGLKVDSLEAHMVIAYQRGCFKAFTSIPVANDPKYSDEPTRA